MVPAVVWLCQIQRKTFRMSMLKNVLKPASGHGKFWKTSAKTIRFAKQGCTNRPFYQIVVMERRKPQQEAVIEQVGTYDPMPNKFNQKMVSLNYERIRHWLGSGAHISRPVAELIGLSGFLPIYPKTYLHAWKVRQELQKKSAAEASTETAAEPAS